MDSETFPIPDPAPPRLAVPRQTPSGASLWRRILALRDSTIAIWSDEAFDAELIEQRLGKRKLFVANAPDLVAHVLRDNAANYIKTPIVRGLLEPGLGTGLLTAEGDVWRHQRRMLAPIFTAKRVADFAPAMTRHAARLLDAWDRLGSGSRLDVATAMSALTLDIISEAMFSVVDDPVIGAIGQAVAVYQEKVRPSFADILGLPAWVPRLGRGRAKAIFAKADRVIHDIIDARRRNGGPDDLLSAMLAAEEQPTAESAREVRDQVATIFAAGHETTANAMTWTWYLLSLHPEAAARLHAELDSVLGGRLPTFADLPLLTYTRMVIDESMRLYPPVHTMARLALADDSLQGRRVPAGAAVMVVPWLLHRHRKLWKDPERFDPLRFSTEAAAARPRFAFIPFGIGPRVCIGAAFATTEAVLLLAAIAQHWRLRLAENAAIEPVGLITLRPRNGLPMILERRA